MKVIVSGASGFVGSHLIDECVKSEFETIGIVRDIDLMVRKNSSTLYVTMDNLLESPARMESIAGSDCFFHFAWSGTSGNDRTDINKQLTNIGTLYKCLKIASEAGCTKFINACSIMEYEVIKKWISSDSSYTMSEIYSTMKLSSDILGRIIAENMGMRYISLIISNIYGPNEMSERFVYTVLKKMIQNSKILLTDCKQLYDFIYISDAVRAMISVAENGVNGNYYIGNAEQHPLRSFVEIMKEVTNSKSELCFGAVENKTKGHVYADLNCSRIYDELGFKTAVAFDEGIRITTDYIRGGI